jgi:WD40 repeat protein
LNDIAAAPTGDAAALAYDDGTVEIVEVEMGSDGNFTGGHPRVFKAHQGEVHSLAFISHNQLATAGEDGVVRVWMLDGPQSRFLDLSGVPANGVLISPDGESLLYASRRGHLTVDLKHGQIFDRSTQAIPADAPIAWSPDGVRKLFPQTIAGQTLLAIVTREGVPQCSIRHQGVARDAEFSPCGKYVAVVGDEQLQLYDSVTGKAAAKALTGVQGNALAFSPDGDRLVYAGALAPIVDCDSLHFPSMRKLGDREDARCLKFSPDGTTLATGHGDGTICLWDFSTGELKTLLTGHRRPVRSLQFTPDGRVLLSSSADGGLRVWSVERGREVGRIASVGLPEQGSTDWCELSMSNDGDRIAIGYRPVGMDRIDVMIVDVRPVETQ